MIFASIHKRASFQVKVLVPVVTVMVLLTIATIWLVNRRISAQLEQQATQQLERDNSIFAKFESIRTNNLISKFQNIGADSRYQAMTQPQGAAKSNTALTPFLLGVMRENGATIATYACSRYTNTEFASACIDPDLDVRQFQQRSSPAIAAAFDGRPVTETVSAGPKLYDVVCIPVGDNSGQMRVVTLGIELGPELMRDIKQVTHSEIVFVAHGQVAASSLVRADLYPLLLARFAELSAPNPAQPFAQARQIRLNGQHYICEAGKFALSGNVAGTGYLLLSSYEDAWQVLKATQQMLLAIGLFGIGVSTIIVWYLIRRVTYPLRELRKSAEAVGRGDYDQRVEVTSYDECGQLATAFNQMTENIKTSREELEKTVETLKAAQHQLIQSEKLSGIGEFVAGVAHELNNPLTSVMGFSELLQQSDLPEQQRRYLDVIFKSAKRCQKIVQSLLSFARRHAPERKVLCVNEVIESAVEILQYQMRTSNIEVMMQLDPKLPATELDPHQMQQVFLNIINNARQAMEGEQKRGRLRVATETAGDKVRIIFEDNGPGIPPENIKRIFNPFFTTKEVGKGTGLGLSLCYGIISEHGGTITPQSVVGQGATFVIELPITQKPAVAPQHTNTDQFAAAESEGTGKRVLVVDDEDMILQMIREVLTRNGYKVDIAHDGESALRRLSQYHYDLALCDWKMPGLNGQQVFERLNASNPEMSRRLIFITGDVVNEKVQEFLRSKNKVCLSKPFTLVEFRSAISQVLNSN